MSSINFLTNIFFKNTSSLETKNKKDFYENNFMKGNFDKNEKKVDIIGAGISGLLCGYFLQKAGFDVKIFESSSKPGGLIDTITTPYGQIETAAHIIKMTPLLDSVCKDLNLQTFTIKAKKRLFLKNGKLISPKFFNLNFSDIIQLFFRITFVQIKPLSFYKNLQHFTDRHFGKKISSNIFSAISRGIFSCDINQLSPLCFFSSFLKKRARGLTPLFSSHIREHEKIHRPRPIISTILPKILPKLFQKRLPIVLISGGTKELINHLSSKLDISYNIKISDLSDDRLRKDSNRIIAAEASFFAPQIEFKAITHLWIFFKRSEITETFAIGALQMGLVQSSPLLGVLFNGSMSYENKDYYLFTCLFDGQIEDTSFMLSEFYKTEITKTGVSHLHIETKITTNAIPVYSKSLFDYNPILPEKTCITGNYLGTLSVSGCADEINNFILQYGK